MSFNVMDAHQRQLRRIADGFGLCHPHQKRSHEPRAVGYTHGIQILQGNPCLIQCLFYDIVDLFYMLS